MPQDVGAWLHIGQNGEVTVFTGKVEVGQNIRTSLAQAVAEELRTPLDSIRMVMGDTALCPFDMGTFGSMTTPMMSPHLRRAGAAAREALIDLAAKQWGNDRASLSVRDGRVVNGSKSASFCELHAMKAGASSSVRTSFQKSSRFVTVSLSSIGESSSATARSQPFSKTAVTSKS